MAMFSQQFIDQVAQATDIVDLIGQYVALHKKGKEFVGLCPFHQDKHPSMNVSPAKQIFKCFACGAGGQAFNFVMMYEKITFPDAVRVLAERANIPLPVQTPGQPVAQDGLGKSDLVRVMGVAQEFFRKSLHTAMGESALAYARKRGLTDESLDRFGIGFAPDAWDALIKATRNQRVTEAQLVAAGLVARRESGGCYDRFRNRLTFPIYDATNQIIAFGGRALAADEQAKYLNSPETIVFDKSSNLYALNWARPVIVSSKQAVVVEGYLDAIMPHQCGVGNVVATLGTSLTERHVRVLSRYASEVVLVFDADAAGAAAAERAMEIFLSQQVHVRVATIPAGKDPCDYCLAEGGEAFKTLLANAPDALEYVWQKRQAELETATGNLADRRRLVENFLGLVAQSQAYGAIDTVRQSQLAQHIGHLLNIPPAELQQEMRRLSRQVRPTARSGAAPATTGSAIEGTLRPQRHVLEVLLNKPELFDTAAERVSPRDFTDASFARIAQCLWQAAAEGVTAPEQITCRAEIADLGNLLADLIATGEHRGNFEDTLRGAMDFISYQRSRQEAQQAPASEEERLRAATERPKADVRRRPRIT
ncbi:MAG: DNA primase [Planctomycetaceae bacterium]|nr:DNA primase [Planctomycetaceae bacterium]